MFLPDGGQPFELTNAETRTLTKTMDGRLFMSGVIIAGHDFSKKQHVLTVAYACDEQSGTALETHLHVFADGTVGYLRTMNSYCVYPMREYVSAALAIGKRHGLIPGQ